MELLYRTALIVTPKRRFLEWANGLPDTDEPMTAAELTSLRAIYLGAVGDSPPPLDELIDIYWEEIFEQFLDGWVLDESLWPANRTPHVFRDWFHVEVVDAVQDMDPGEPVTIHEHERTRCAVCDSDLTADAIAVASFADRHHERMTISELELVRARGKADDPSQHFIAFRCCREECAKELEASLEQAWNE
jgi:hypothetical protein